MMFGRDADAIVFDVDPNQPRSLFGPNDHRGSNAAGDKLHGIAQNVSQNLLEG